MSQDPDLSLSRRAVAAGFSSRDGTALVDPEKNWPWRVAGGLIVWDHHAGWPGGPPSCDEGPSIARAMPDFRDAGTNGILMQLVRERWDDPRAFTVPIWKQWRTTVHTPDGRRYYFGLTEAESRVAALEKAPCKF